MNKLERIFSNQELEKSELEAIEKLNWWVTQDTEDYLDIQFDKTYQAETDVSDLYTFDLFFTIDRQNRVFWMGFYQNLGDGPEALLDDFVKDDLNMLESFDQAVSKLMSVDESEANEDQRKAKRIIKAYPSSFQAIREQGIKVLEDLLKSEA